jgi:2-desacetyl-2-hydroxyethyl bacteriochlorophyllide A dehydrogenase
MKTYPMVFISKPGRIEFRDIPLRDPSPGEVMIKVKAAAICGSDLHLYKGKHPSAELPSAVGHELSGVVFNVGKGVTRIKTGDHVVVEPTIACGKCHYCVRGQYHLCENLSFQYRTGQGAFAEYFYAMKERTYLIPNWISFEQAALIEPLSVALHAVKKSNLKIGDSCAVFGVGAIGLLVCRLASMTTGGQVFGVDISDFRLKKAVDMGAMVVVDNASEDVLEVIRDGTGGLGVDHAFEAVGMSLTLTQAIKAVKKGGVVTLLGIYEDLQSVIPLNLFIQRELSMIGSQSYAWDFENAIELVTRKQIDLSALITHKFALREIQKGFDLLLTPSNQAIKVLSLFE